MKLLILSDSHGRRDLVRRAAELHADAAALLFLGDGLRDLPEDLPMPVYAVRGNCDVFFDATDTPAERLELFSGYRLFAMHGHTREVKFSMTRAIAAAFEAKADLLCYGHTHVPVESYIPAGEFTMFGQPNERPLYLFNPGALRMGSFGLAELRREGILLSHGCL